MATAGDPADLGVADRMAGIILHYLGDQTDARRHLERRLARPAVRVRHSQTVRFLLDERVTVRALLSRILWLQGFPDQANPRIPVSPPLSRPRFLLQRGLCSRSGVPPNVGLALSRCCRADFLLGFLRHLGNALGYVVIEPLRLTIGDQPAFDGGLRARPQIIESTFDRVRYGVYNQPQYRMLWW